MNKVITIDGIENGLKNEVCREIASRLGCYWVSTETFHRGIAYIVLQKGVNIENVQDVLNIIFYDDWEAKIKKEKTQFEYNGADISDQLYLPEVTNMMNQLRTLPKVQKHMLNALRDCADLGKPLVAGGSDCGTIVFPEADEKFYLKDSNSHVLMAPDIEPIEIASATAQDIAAMIVDRVI